MPESRLRAFRLCSWLDQPPASSDAERWAPRLIRTSKARWRAHRRTALGEYPVVRSRLRTVSVETPTSEAARATVEPCAPRATSERSTARVPSSAGPTSTSTSSSSTPTTDASTRGRQALSGSAPPTRSDGEIRNASGRGWRARSGALSAASAASPSGTSGRAAASRVCHSRVSPTSSASRHRAAHAEIRAAGGAGSWSMTVQAPEWPERGTRRTSPIMSRPSLGGFRSGASAPPRIGSGERYVGASCSAWGIFTHIVQIQCRERDSQRLWMTA